MIFANKCEYHIILCYYVLKVTFKCDIYLFISYFIITFALRNNNSNVYDTERIHQSRE